MSIKNNIMPLGDRVLVKPVSEEGRKSKTSGIILPETIDKEKAERGRIVAAGPGRTADDGKLVPLKVKVGQTVIFSKYSPDEIKIEGEEYFILREENILAVIK